MPCARCPVPSDRPCCLCIEFERGPSATLPPPNAKARCRRTAAAWSLISMGFYGPSSVTRHAWGPRTRTWAGRPSCLVVVGEGTARTLLLNPDPVATRPLPQDPSSLSASSTSGAVASAQSRAGAPPVQAASPKEARVGTFG